MSSSTTAKSTTTSLGLRRRLKLLLFVVVLFMSWAGYTLIIQQSQASDRAAQMKDINAKLADAQKKNEQLKLEITRLNDDEYIGQIAHQQGMSRPGERSIQVKKPNP